jgi:hypothetical protein
MSRVKTANDIVGQSSYVLGRHRKLLVFPLLSLVALYVIFMYFLGPLMFHTTSAELGYAFWHTGRHGLPAGTYSIRNLPFGWFAVTHLVGMFVATFINFAFYSQVIQALNGGQVSVARGFKLALARLPSIVAWSLFAGTLGVLLRMLQERLPLVGQWITGLLGFAGSVAAALVIPVMLNEPRATSPIGYLRISANLVKRVWGEGLIGTVSMAMAGVFVMMAVMLLGAIIGMVTQLHWITSLGILAFVGIAVLLECLAGIFRCGLYIYATEGVPPGPFDADTLNRAWTVKASAPRS